MKDLFEAIQERDRKIESVTWNATSEFHKTIRDVVMTILLIHDQFTADDIWVEADKRKINGFSSDPRALGGLLKMMAKERLIRPTGHWQPSRRRHAAPIMVWERMSE